MKTQIPGTISKVGTLADNTIRVQFDAQEIAAEEMANLFALKGRLGWIVFSEQLLKEEDVRDLPEIRAEFGEKTPGQRLRGVLYILWEQTKSSLSFEQFYREKMESIITMLKDKLDPP